MRYTAIDVDLTLNPPYADRRAQRSPWVARIHWPRVVAIVVTLGMWPAIIFAVTRLL